MDGRQDEWRWDPTLYSGSAPYYVRGRVPYPPPLIDLVVAGLDIAADKDDSLLDLGCGPGSLTLPLAPHAARVVGVDPDPHMLAEAQRQADLIGVANVDWRQARGEDVSARWGAFTAATMAQSFHWMDRTSVASRLYRVLTEDGTLAFVHATTHEGVPDATPGLHPRPPRADVEHLIRHYLGQERRAGAGHRKAEAFTEAERGRIEAVILREAGFRGPERHEIAGYEVERTTDEIVGSVFSLSYAAPHLFGDRIRSFERDLRSLLDASSDSGTFSELMREIAVDIWRKL